MFALSLLPLLDNGKNVVDSHDTWVEQKQTQVKLEKHLQEAKADRCKKCTIKFRHHLTVNRSNYYTLFAIFVMLAVGIVFGMVQQEWSFITSLYFSVTAMSTAGLQAIQTEDAFSFVFTGVFCLVGVPVYGMALGSLASILLKRKLAQDARAEFTKTISLEEFEETQISLPSHDKDDDTTAIEVSFFC